MYYVPYSVRSFGTDPPSAVYSKNLCRTRNETYVCTTRRRTEIDYILKKSEDIDETSSKRESGMQLRMYEKGEEVLRWRESVA